MQDKHLVAPWAIFCLWVRFGDSLRTDNGVISLPYFLSVWVENNIIHSTIDGFKLAKIERRNIVSTENMYYLVKNAHYIEIWCHS